MNLKDIYYYIIAGSILLLFLVHQGYVSISKSQIMTVIGIGAFVLLFYFGVILKRNDNSNVRLTVMRDEMKKIWTNELFLDGSELDERESFFIVFKDRKDVPHGLAIMKNRATDNYCLYVKNMVTGLQVMVWDNVSAGKVLPDALPKTVEDIKAMMSKKQREVVYRTTPFISQKKIFKKSEQETSESSETKKDDDDK